MLIPWTHARLFWVEDSAFNNKFTKSFVLLCVLFTKHSLYYSNNLASPFLEYTYFLKTYHAVIAPRRRLTSSYSDIEDTRARGDL